MFYYIVGSFINYIINSVLKRIIQQPRNGSQMNHREKIETNTYGMPSCHAQMALFSTVFLYFALKKRWILYVYLFISAITMIQRVVHKRHTLLQVIVGAFIGAFVGYSFSQMK